MNTWTLYLYSKLHVNAQINIHNYVHILFAYVCKRQYLHPLCAFVLGKCAFLPGRIDKRHADKYYNLYTFLYKINTHMNLHLYRLIFKRARRKNVIINGVEIENTYAEGFPMAGTRFLVTADTMEWAREAGRKATGFATSIIACGCEADIESEFPNGPDGRPGVSVVILSMNLEMVAAQALNRVGQCVMTCPTTACFNGWEGGERIDIGKSLRYFGDGRQLSKTLFGKRYWRIPVMDGEFLVEESFGTFADGSDSNIILLGSNPVLARIAAEHAVDAMRASGGIILPFPGGIVRSGSKVGSKYKALRASTNHSFCPTLKDDPETLLPENANCVYEIVICGARQEDIRRAMARGIHAAAREGIVCITAGNYGGKLGKVHYPLWEILSE